MNHLRFGYSCPFVFREPAGLTGLNALTGVGLSGLAKLTCPSAEAGDADPDEQLFFDSPVPKYFIRVVDTKICPGCLRESNYCRKVWDLAAVTACPVHATILLDECPNCRRRVLWSRKAVSVCTCGFDWRGANLPPLRESELKVAGHIYRLCGYQLSGGEFGFDESNPTLALNLKGFLANLFFIAGQYKNVAATKGKTVAAKVRNSELHPQLSKAFAVFDNWPHNFHEFLEWRQENNDDTLRSTERETGLYRAFGRFYEGIYKESGTGHFDLLRNAFTEYVAQHWSGGQVKEISKQALLTGADEWKYVSKDEAKRQLRIDVLCVDRYIESGRLKAVVLKSGGSKKFLVEVSSLEKLKREFGRSLSFNEAMARLGISKQPLQHLIRSGLIEALRGPAVEGTGHWRFSPDAIDDLLGKLGGGVTSSASAPVRDELSFHQVVRRFTPLGLTVGGIIKAILDRQIVPCRVISGVGVRRFLFEEEAVARFKQATKSIRPQEPTKVRC